jgi:arylformamidase
VNSSVDFYDREYNPRSQIPEFGTYFARWKAQAFEVRKTQRGQLNVSFGPSPHELLDYFPATVPDAPILLFIHGGYWRAMDKADFSWVAPPFVAAGIATAVLNYGLLPATPLREIVAQINHACVWIHDNCEALHVDPHRIFCAGHSAGGHLTAMLLATEWPAVRPDIPKRLLAGAFTVSGLFDLEPLTRAEFLKHDLALDQEEARAFSPCYLPLHNHAPLLRAVGALESREFHRQSALIATRWPSVCEHPLIDVPGCNHLSVCDAIATPGSVLFETIRVAVLNSST